MFFKFTLQGMITVKNLNFSSLFQRNYQAIKFHYNSSQKIKKETSYKLVKIIKKWPRLGWGRFGDIHLVKVFYQGKVLPFAVKEFRDACLAQYAIEQYSLLKKAEIPTRNTYRLLQRKKSKELPSKILMTLGNVDGSLCFSVNNYSLDWENFYKSGYLKKVENLHELFEQGLEIIKKSTQNNLIIPRDSYFFRLKDNCISVFIGDMDSIWVWKDDPSTNLFLMNNCSFLAALRALNEDWERQFDSFLEKKNAEKLIDIEENL